MNTSNDDLYEILADLALMFAYLKVQYPDALADVRTLLEETERARAHLKLVSDNSEHKH